MPQGGDKVSRLNGVSFLFAQSMLLCMDHLAVPIHVRMFFIGKVPLNHDRISNTKGFSFTGICSEMNLFTTVTVHIQQTKKKMAHSGFLF